MSSNFDVGDQISFYGGRGSVIEIRQNGSDQILVVLTEDGGQREVRTSMPMIEKVGKATEGDLVDFLGGRGKVIARESREDNQDLLYIQSEEGDIKKVPADCEGLEPGLSVSKRLSTGKFDDPNRFSLRERAARLNLAYRSDRFLSLSGNRIRIEPYQVDAAHEVLTSYEPRYLIGDEVGLGKTIEAGMIIEELVARGRAERVLIVTPASLRDQWQREMRDKFGREYVTYDRGYINSVDRPGKNIWQAEDQIVVSVDLAKQDDLLDQLNQLKEPWDIVVFDEAHHLTARETSSGTERVDRYRVGEAVADNSDALLFLTGTPHKGKPDQFYNLLRLLDPYRFKSPEDITPEKLDDLMIRRMKTDESMVDADGNPMFPDRQIKTVPVELTPEERDLYDDLTEYISAVYTASADTDSHTAGFTMVIYQKRLVSSIAAITKSLENRREDLEQKVSIPSGIAEKLNRVDDSAETEEDILKQLIEAGKSIGIDSKGEKLRQFIDGILNEDPDEKILLFTEYTDTLEYLRKTVLSDYSTAVIDGSMDQENRRNEIESFRDEANILLATDAAREGLNLQFAHLMVNYDLPWNPIRIDQRMGRLHRYGQEETVKIHNLFIQNTRESDILETLVGKIETIEDDLGKGSDVLGTILDDYDVEGAIMDAVTGERDPQEVEADLDDAIEERKDAVQKIEEEFLIQDKFEADDHQEIENLIDLSKEQPIGEDDIEQLVYEFCEEFGGKFKTDRRSSAQGGHSLHDISVPDIISMNTEVDEHYSGVTFSRSVAIDNPDAELVSLNHPLVQEIIQYCLDGDWIDGQAAALVSENSDRTPGILATYRLGYISGDGDVPTEDYARVYVDAEGDIHDEMPVISGALPSQLATPHPEAYQTAEQVEKMLDSAREKASEEVEELVEDVQEEREQDVDIKEKHAERYFTQEIRKLEDRLSEYQQQERDTDKDMQVAIDSTRKELRNVEKEWEEEQERLERERMVVPDEPELVNAAVVTSKIPAVDLNQRSSWSLSNIIAAIEGGDEDLISYEQQHTDLESINDLSEPVVRLLRPVSWNQSIDFIKKETNGTELWVDSEYGGNIPSSDIITSFESQLEPWISDLACDVQHEVCVTDKPVDAIAWEGRVLCNIELEMDHSEQCVFWQTVVAREDVFSDSQLPPERRISQLEKTLQQ